MIRRNFVALAAAATFGLAACTPAETGPDIVDVAASAGDFNTLVAAVTAAGLVDTLKGDGPFTVFAPTDAAFAALPAGTVESLLLPENQDDLVAILTYHVVPGVARAADFPAGARSAVTTVNGATVTVDTTSGVTVGGANVVTADIEASNGVIHVVDAVLLP
ncbi:MAG: fasciclin domain-containing protein [Pseudomonadota bacterium]